jgi:cell division protein FtsW (lipid II flippase)
MTFPIVNFLISLVLCYWLTRKSAMSFGWALFFSVCFSFIVGLAGILASGSYGHSKKLAKSKSVWGTIRLFICLLLGVLFIVAAVKSWIIGDVHTILTCLIVGIGFIGNVVYMSLDWVDTYIEEPLNDYQ